MFCSYSNITLSRSMFYFFLCQCQIGQSMLMNMSYLLVSCVDSPHNRTTIVTLSKSSFNFALTPWTWRINALAGSLSLVGFLASVRQLGTPFRTHSQYITSTFRNSYILHQRRKQLCRVVNRTSSKRGVSIVLHSQTADTAFWGKFCFHKAASDAALWTDMKPFGGCFTRGKRH